MYISIVGLLVVTGVYTILGELVMSGTVGQHLRREYVIVHSSCGYYTII